MKKILILICVLASFNALAQDDKALIKEWKAKQKEMKPMDFKKLVDEKAALEKRDATISTELDETRNQVAAKDAELNALRNENKKLEASKNRNAPVAGANVGTIYKVQVGAYKDVDIEGAGGNFNAENNDGIKRYTLGNFKDVEQAKKFRGYVNKLGVQDAFIVEYVEGVRKGKVE